MFRNNNYLLQNKSSLILLLPIILFILNEYYNNKVYSFMTKFYNCCRIFIVVTPLLLVFLNPELLKDVLVKFKGLDNKAPKHKNILKNNRINRNVSESKKKYVAANQEWKCKKCNQVLDATYEVDHVIPLYKGGDNDVSNLEALCRNCHGKKTLLDRIN